MANPFLFDSPQPAASEAENPFLFQSGVPAAGSNFTSVAATGGAPNPFLMSEQSMEQPFQQQVMHEQHQYNSFGAVQMQHSNPPSGHQANPFADYGVPAPTHPVTTYASNNQSNLFGDVPEQPSTPLSSAEEVKKESPIVVEKEEPPPPPPPEPLPEMELEMEQEPIIEVPKYMEELPSPVEEEYKEKQDQDKIEQAQEEPLPAPPSPTEEKTQVSRSPEQEKEDTPEKVEISEPEPLAEVETPAGPSTGANLFGLEQEPEIVDRDDADSDKEEELEKPKMSTGDAIFADLPAGDVSSTGASIFGLSEESAAGTTGANLFGVTAPTAAQPSLGSMSGWDDNFDRKFDDAAEEEPIPVPVIPGDPFDPFSGTGAGTMAAASGAFGENTFGQSSFNPVAPNSTPSIPRRTGEVPSAFANPVETSNPFLAGEQKADNDDDIDSPLFDDDTSKPLEPFPRLACDAPGWEMYIRHPPKKKLTAQRFWKKIFVRIVMQGDIPCVQLFENKDAKDAFQELPLQVVYSLSDIAHQVFDQYSKIFTLKLQYIFYKERAGIRPGQISKMQKLTDKIGFLAKAVEDADYQGVKEFASDMKKLGVPLEHAPQISELLKLGSDNYEDMKQFSVCIEEKLFKMDAHRDRALTYKTEEVQLTAVDEVYVEQDKTGHVSRQLCRVRVFFLSFLTGMPDVELGVNDIVRMGLEVVGRHDILPVPTEQWIRYEDIEFHQIVDKKEFEKNDHIIKFQPPDACYLEIMRFRVRPPKARELPMQARCQFIITGNRVEIKADMMIPYHHTKAWGQVPCEDVSMRIPLPECWIYQFRTEKHHISLSQLAVGNLNIGSRMGSVKSAHRRAGKVKGMERFMGALETQTQDLMETSSGQAKYEHQHKAIVWRVPRLPKHGQGSYTNHEFVCKLTLTSFDQMPESFEKHFYVEFTQPATSISNTVLRSVSIQNGSGEPPEKFAKYLARHEYRLEIDFAEKEQNTYMQVTKKVEDPKPDEDELDKEYPDFPDENGKKRDSDSDSD